MSSEPVRLPYGIFGYRRSAIERMFTERDALARLAQGRVQAAEAKADNLGRKLSEAHTEIERMAEEIEHLRSSVDPLSSLTASSKFLDEELASILAAVQNAAHQIIERARLAADVELSEASRVWSQIEHELKPFPDWQAERERLGAEAGLRIEAVRGAILAVSDRIREVLDSLGTAAARDIDPSSPDVDASSPDVETVAVSPAESTIDLSDEPNDVVAVLTPPRKGHRNTRARSDGAGRSKRQGKGSSSLKVEELTLAQSAGSTTMTGEGQDGSNPPSDGDGSKRRRTRRKAVRQESG
jgi:hypothetical protein